MCKSPERGMSLECSRKAKRWGEQVIGGLEGKLHRNQWESFELCWAGRRLLGGDAPGTEMGRGRANMERAGGVCVCVCVWSSLASAKALGQECSRQGEQGPDRAGPEGGGNASGFLF